MDNTPARLHMVIDCHESRGGVLVEVRSDRYGMEMVYTDNISDVSEKKGATAGME